MTGKLVRPWSVVDAEARALAELAVARWAAHRCQNPAHTLHATPGFVGDLHRWIRDGKVGERPPEPDPRYLAAFESVSAVIDPDDR